MEFQQLTYFLAAARTQNFRKAAELCFVVQSALSRQIAALEAELEVELFTRKKKRVTLTPAGQEFAQYVKSALAQLQQGQLSLTNFQAGQRGTIRLGCVESLATTFLPPLFATFHQQYPLVRLQIRVGHSDELISLVEQGEVELGLILDPGIRSELLIVRELFRQSLQVLASTRHPLARKAAPVTIKQIAEEPLFLLDQTSRLGQITERIFAQRGLAVQPLVEIESVEGLKEFVRQGQGATLTLPALLREQRPGDDLVLLPIADVTEEFIFALIYRRAGPLSQAARMFVNTIIPKDAI